MKRKEEQINVRMESNVHQALERISRERQQSISHIIRQLSMWFVAYYDRAPDRAMAEIASALPPRPREE